MAGSRAVSAPRAAAARPRRPLRWRFLALSWSPVVCALGLCPVVAALAPRGPAIPIAHARELASFERVAGAHFEGSLARIVSRHQFLRAALENFYMWVHLPVLIGVLVWVALERPASFSFARDTFVFAQCLTAAVYLLMPTAPPWAVTAHHTPELLAGRLVYRLQSRFAAMPSGHVVFAVVAAGTVACLARSRILRLIALGYPPLVTFVVLATGNHLWVDVVAGVLVAAAGAGAAGWKRQARFRCPARRLPVSAPGPQPAKDECPGGVVSPRAGTRRSIFVEPTRMGGDMG